ncbi:MAG: sulfurtransferase [Proteobacteria bacterium]|nr:MAG: sulfurtransferase [Pseudomonadota bacterium]PIE66703.1 MAG: sulfurtransferase [Deltaproteobacteria bacterium]
MTIDRVILVFAGTMILVSLLLSQIHSGYWLWFTAFVGANLLQSSITGFCPVVKVLKFLGVKPGPAFD